MTNVLIIDNGSTLIDKLSAIVPATKTLCSWNDIPTVWDDFDLVVLSGSSRFPVYGNEDMLKTEIQLIQQTTKPLIGICFGHELVAHSFGGILTALPNPHVGITEVRVMSDHGMFRNKKTFEVYENHRFGVVETGNMLDTLAHTNHATAVIKHKTKQIYGFQFHPEHHVEQQYGDEVFLQLVSSLIL